MRRRVGIYAGTFDPIHPGHIAFAVEAMRTCDLDEVVLLIEQTPRGKDRVTDVNHRIALTERAVASTPGLRVIRVASKQFTVAQTIPELRAVLGASELTLLLGSDVCLFLDQWPGVNTLLTEVSFAVGVRTHANIEAIKNTMKRLSDAHQHAVRYRLVSTSEAAWASSQIRNGTADISRLHPEMLAYMQAHHLYT